MDWKEYREHQASKWWNWDAKIKYSWLSFPACLDNKMILHDIIFLWTSNWPSKQFLCLSVFYPLQLVGWHFFLSFSFAFHTVSMIIIALTKIIQVVYSLIWEMNWILFKSALAFLLFNFILHWKNSNIKKDWVVCDARMNDCLIWAFINNK